MPRAVFVLNVFTAGVAFALIGCAFDETLPIRQPIWWNGLAFVACSVVAFKLRRA